MNKTKVSYRLRADVVSGIKTESAERSMTQSDFVEMLYDSQFGDIAQLRAEIDLLRSEMDSLRRSIEKL